MIGISVTCPAPPCSSCHPTADQRRRPGPKLTNARTCHEGVDLDRSAIASRTGDVPFRVTWSIRSEGLSLGGSASAREPVGARGLGGAPRGLRLPAPRRHDAAVLYDGTAVL